jgi:hypothetical protein
MGKTNVDAESEAFLEKSAKRLLRPYWKEITWVELNQNPYQRPKNADSSG